MELSGLIVIVAMPLSLTAIAPGFDLIHPDTIMMATTEVGMTTPPVGLSPFVTSLVALMPVNKVVSANLLWRGILFFLLTIVACVPWDSTFLTNATMRPKIITK